MVGYTGAVADLLTRHKGEEMELSKPSGTLPFPLHPFKILPVAPHPIWIPPASRLHSPSSHTHPTHPSTGTPSPSPPGSTALIPPPTPQLALLPNRGQQHSRVRLVVIEAPGALVSAGCVPAGHIEQLVCPALRPDAYDRTPAVREVLSAAVAGWLGGSASATPS